MKTTEQTYDDLSSDLFMHTVSMVVTALLIVAQIASFFIWKPF